MIFGSSFFLTVLSDFGQKIILVKLSSPNTRSNYIFTALAWKRTVYQKKFMKQSVMAPVVMSSFLKKQCKKILYRPFIVNLGLLKCNPNKFTFFAELSLDTKYVGGNRKRWMKKAAFSSAKSPDRLWQYTLTVGSKWNWMLTLLLILTTPCLLHY